MGHEISARSASWWAGGLNEVACHYQKNEKKNRDRDEMKCLPKRKRQRQRRDAYQTKTRLHTKKRRLTETRCRPKTRTRGAGCFWKCRREGRMSSRRRGGAVAVMGCCSWLVAAGWFHHGLAGSWKQLEVAAAQLGLGLWGR